MSKDLPGPFTKGVPFWATRTTYQFFHLLFPFPYCSFNFHSFLRCSRECRKRVRVLLLFWGIERLQLTHSLEFGGHIPVFLNAERIVDFLNVYSRTQFKSRRK